MTIDIIGITESLIEAKDLNEFIEDTKSIHLTHKARTKCKNIKNKKYYILDQSQFWQFQKDLLKRNRSYLKLRVLKHPKL